MAVLLIDGQSVPPDHVDIPRGAYMCTPRSPDLPLAAFEMRVPVQAIVNEFGAYAHEQHGEDLTAANAAAWLRRHLHDAPEDVYVVLAIVQQTSQCSPRPKGIRAIFGRKRSVDQAAWQLSSTEAVDQDQDELVINGTCHPIQR